MLLMTNTVLVKKSAKTITYKTFDSELFKKKCFKYFYSLVLTSSSFKYKVLIFLFFFLD